MGMLLQQARAIDVFSEMATEFACIENAPGLFPPKEVVPLGPRVTQLDGLPSAIFLDMDGTTTDTEPLFLHGLAQVVRRSTGWRTVDTWEGLDPDRDYPRIVGYSTIRNLEYLYGFMGHAIQPPLFFEEILRGLQFLAEHPVPETTTDQIKTLVHGYGLEALHAHAADPGRTSTAGTAIVKECVLRFPSIPQHLFTQFGLMIFYADYIRILEQVNRGEGAAVSQLIYGDSSIPAIHALPGIALLCALVKGWLPPSCVTALAERIRPGDAQAVQDLTGLSERFAQDPIPVALVTSSGSHEANLVLRAVFGSMRDEVASWPIAPPTRARVQAGFARHGAYFDTIVTCDDVIEGRTKPYRDPYTMALTRLGLDGDDARRVVGFEDTEAGIIAQRGAGVGLACAVPITYTLGQDFRAASHVIGGGVLDALFQHNLFTTPSTR